MDKMLEEQVINVTRYTSDLDSLVEAFGPFVDPRIYNDIQLLTEIARQQYLLTLSKKADEVVQKDWLAVASATVVEFATIRQRLFKSISDRIKELSQYDHSAEPPNE